MEGFPSPDAKTMMEAKVNSESEKILTDLSEDERQEREIAFGTTQSVVKGDKMLQELVGDVQLAVEEEPIEALHMNDEPGTSLMAKGEVAREESTSVEREEHDVVHRKRCRHCESAADYGCRQKESSDEETAVPAVFCGH